MLPCQTIAPFILSCKNNNPQLNQDQIKCAFIYKNACIYNPDKYPPKSMKETAKYIFRLQNMLLELQQINKKYKKKQRDHSFFQWLPFSCSVPHPFSEFVENNETEIKKIITYIDSSCSVMHTLFKEHMDSIDRVDDPIELVEFFCYGAKNQSSVEEKKRMISLYPTIERFVFHNELSMKTTRRVAEASRKILDSSQVNTSICIQGKKLIAHRLLLFSCCPHIEEQYDSETNEVDIPDVSPRDFQFVYDWVEAGKHPDFTSMNKKQMKIFINYCPSYIPPIQ